MSVQANQTIYLQLSCGKTIGDIVPGVDIDMFIIRTCDKRIRIRIIGDPDTDLTLELIDCAFCNICQVCRKGRGAKKLLVRNLRHLLIDPFLHFFM